jgi:hypothetical protein
MKCTDLIQGVGFTYECLCHWPAPLFLAPLMWCKLLNYIADYGSRLFLNSFAGTLCLSLANKLYFITPIELRQPFIFFETPISDAVSRKTWRKSGLLYTYIYIYIYIYMSPFSSHQKGDVKKVVYWGATILEWPVNPHCYLALSAYRTWADTHFCG